MNALKIVINEKPVHEYDKDDVLSAQQLEFLDGMDRSMDRGLKINGELISEPDSRQRASFVAMNLIRALMQEDQAKIQVSCAYLAKRLPGLTEVHARDQEGKVAIELIEAA